MWLWKCRLDNIFPPVLSDVLWTVYWIFCRLWFFSKMKRDNILLRPPPPPSSPRAPASALHILFKKKLKKGDNWASPPPHPTTRPTIYRKCLLKEASLRSTVEIVITRTNFKSCHFKITSSVGAASQWWSNELMMVKCSSMMVKWVYEYDRILISPPLLAFYHH